MKSFYIEFEMPKFSFNTKVCDHSGFFGGYNPDNKYEHLRVDNINKAKMMTLKEAEIIGRKLDAWNHPISFKIKNNCLELGI